MRKRAVLEWGKFPEFKYDKRKSLTLYHKWVISDSEDVLNKCWSSLLPFANYLLSLWYNGSYLNYEDDLISILSFKLYKLIEDKEIPCGRGFFAYLKKCLYLAYRNATKVVDKGRKIPREYRPHRFSDPIHGAEDKIFIKEVPPLLRKRISESCRFSPEFEEASHYVINLILSGANPSPHYIKNRWNVDPQLVIDWTLVRCRSILYEIRESLPDLLGKTEMEYFFNESRTFHL